MPWKNIILFVIKVVSYFITRSEKSREDKERLKKKITETFKKEDLDEADINSSFDDINNR